MKKLLTFFFALSVITASAQNFNSTNTKFSNGLQAPNGATAVPTSGLTAGAIFYKTGAGFQYYNGTAWVTLADSGLGVITFNGRSGAVVPLTGDYSSFYPLLNGTGATGTWGIGITGNAGTVTNGVYTTGSYANPSWITSLALSKITGLSDSLLNKANINFNNVPSGAIANSKLANSSITIGSTPISLGGTSTTLAGLTSVSSTGFTGALIGHASLDLAIANNLSDLASASTARTNLGATTVGSNFFTLPNPSAIRFTQINADNSVSALDAASFRTAIGAGTSTVTPAALTKTDDTNVTLTLGGTPSTALLQATSLTLGWTGKLADSRINSAIVWNAKYGNGDSPSFGAVAGSSFAIPGGTSAQFLKANGSVDNNTYQSALSGTGYAKFAGTTPSYVSSIPNADLANSTISGVSLGGTLFALTPGYGLTNPGTYTGAAIRTFASDSTVMANKTWVNGRLTSYSPYWSRALGILSPVTATDSLRINGTVGIGIAPDDNIRLHQNDTTQITNAGLEQFGIVSKMNLYKTTSGAFTNVAVGILARPTITALNTRDWTNPIALVGLEGTPSTLSGATGSVRQATGVMSKFDYYASGLRTYRMVHFYAYDSPSALGTIDSNIVFWAPPQSVGTFKRGLWSQVVDNKIEGFLEIARSTDPINTKFRLTSESGNAVFNATNENIVLQIGGNEAARINTNKVLTVGDRSDATASGSGLLNITYPLANTSTTDTRAFSVTSNEAIGGAWKLSIRSIGNSTSTSRKFLIQTSNEGVGSEGILALQAAGGLIGLGTSAPLTAIYGKGVHGFERSSNTEYSTIDNEGNFQFNALNGYNFVFKGNGVERFRVGNSGVLEIPTAPATSAGSYDILTRNSSTGAVEKVAGTPNYWSRSGTSLSPVTSGDYLVIPSGNDNVTIDATHVGSVNTVSGNSSSLTNSTLVFHSGGGSDATLSANTLTGNRAYKLPDNSGTIALTSDLGSQILSTTIGINSASVANTSLYTVPTGKTAVITGYVVTVSAATSVTNGASGGIGNSAGTNNISASQAMNALLTTSDDFVWAINGMSKVTAAAGVIYYNNTTAITGTSQTITVQLLGYLK